MLLPAFNTERKTLDQRGMRVLGAWAFGNIGVSGARYFATSGSEKYFHQMNVGWGAINATLAGAALLSARREDAPLSRAETTRRQIRTENIYLFNTGLDVAYVVGGFWLLQGGFLLVFDGLMYAAHHGHANKRLYPVLSRVRFGPGTLAVVF
jgi:hypothetical protein